MSAIPGKLPGGVIGRITQGIGSIVNAAVDGFNRSGYVACFVRKHYKTSDLMNQFGIRPGDFIRANPGLIASGWIPSGTVILLPGIGCMKGPRDRTKAHHFDLSYAHLPPPLFHDTAHKDELRDRSWMPAKPPFKQANREATFGRFEYEDDPSSDGGDGINILGGWEQANIGSVIIPQLARFRKNGKTYFNKKAHDQFRGLFNAWEKAGLINLIVSWDGSFNPRYMRKAVHDRAHLSNHSWGTAFDINASYNKLGKPVAKLGQTGCVLELVEIGYEYGFYWGGYFGKGRSDGMHFEVAKLL
jgi:hypothetical protein